MRGSVPLPAAGLTPARGTSHPGRTCSTKRCSAAKAACSSVPRTCTAQRSPCRTSAEIIASTLFKLAVEPVRRLVRKDSEAKSFAASARWLAGRACKPSDREQVNANSSDVPTLCVISTLDLGENAMGILQSFLQRHLNHLDSVESLAFLHRDVDGENRNLCLADIVLRQFVFNAHGALSLHLDVVAEGFRDLLQSRGSHVSVGNARGAGSNSDDLHAASSSLPSVNRLLRAFSRLIEIAVTIVPVTIANMYASL